MSVCASLRFGVFAESEPGTCSHVSAESTQSLLACSHQYVCCHHEVQILICLYLQTIHNCDRQLFFKFEQNVWHVKNDLYPSQ